MIFINLHVFLALREPKSWQWGGRVLSWPQLQVSGLCFPPSFFIAPLLYFFYKRTYISWNIPLYFLPTPGTLGLSRNKQGRKVEHLVKATSGGCQRLSSFSWCISLTPNEYLRCSFSKTPQLSDGAKMRGTEPTLLGQGPKLPPICSKEELLLPIHSQEELLLPICNNQESKTRHQRVFHLASCQPGLRGISRRRSLKRVQDRKKSRNPRDELLTANLWSSCWSI